MSFHHAKRFTLLPVMSLFAILSFFGTVLAQERPTPRVINGTSVPEGAYPWMVALLIRDKTDSTEAHFCGGSLISPTLVLTAAHCAEGFDPTSIQTLVGARTLPFGLGDRVDVVGIIVHPEYNSITLEHDAALLRLAHPVPGPYLAPALQSDADLYKPGTIARVLGWGTTDPNLPILPTVLQQGDIPIKSDITCLNDLGRYFKPATMLCGGKLSSSATTIDGVDSCYGDSGGPLMVRDSGNGWKQVGIVSWGFGCASPKFYGVYSEVPANEQFVTSFPTFPPFPVGFPTISGDAEVGSALSCQPGAFVGDPVASYIFEWQRYGTTIPGATAATYTLTPDDADTDIQCVVQAQNAGGVSSATYSDVVHVAFFNPTPSPTPIPSATPTPANLGAPSVAVTSFSCKGRACKAQVRASDPDGPNDVVSVSATVLLSYLAKCPTTNGHLVSCTKTRVSNVALVHDGGDVWSFTTRILPGVSRAIALELTAVDSVGNSPLTTSSFHKKFKIPGKK